MQISNLLRNEKIIKKSLTAASKIKIAEYGGRDESRPYAEGSQGFE